MPIFIFGPPGSGKGSQCQLLSETFHYRHISSGDLLRHEKEQNSHRGELIRSAIASGDLVPDEIVIDLIKDEVRKNDQDYILDGMPRNIHQAEILTGSKMIPNFLLILEIDEDLLISRLENRRICPVCADVVFNIVSNPPKREGYCDYCGQELVKRADDCKETIQHRLDLYHQETEPVFRYYWKLLGYHSLIKVPGKCSILSTFQYISGVIKSYQL